MLSEALEQNLIPTPAPAAATIEADGETVVLNRSTGAIHVLNGTGAVIWSRLDGSRSAGAIVEELSEAFGVERDRVARDVQEFLAGLVALGLLEGGREPASGDWGRAARLARGPLSASLDSVWVDWYTAQVVDALRTSGIESILLKGPAIRRWLYADDPRRRGYLDADLLVPGESFERAAAVLSELGFRPQRGSISLWATAWRRDADGAAVDLHHTLQGCEHSTVDPWPILRASAVAEEVGGTCVLLASLPARLVGVALVSPADRPWRRWDDRQRALERAPVDLWREALGVARALGVERLFGYRLSQTPAGAALASRIGAPAAPGWWLRWEADPLLRWAGWLAALPSWRARLALVRRLALPTPEEIRSRQPETSTRGLAAAYGGWAAHVLGLLPGATATLLRSLHRRRQVGSGEASSPPRAS